MPDETPAEAAERYAALEDELETMHAMLLGLHAQWRAWSQLPPEDQDG